MIARFWEQAKPLLAGCVMWALLVEGIGSWRAGHWLNADEFTATEDGTLRAFGGGLAWLALWPFEVLGTAGGLIVWSLIYVALWRLNRRLKGA
jgi:hypothetical protein